MRFSTIAGIAFIGLVAIVLGGIVPLGVVRESSEGPIRATRIFGAVGLAWMLALWGSLVACMIFLIAWVAESMPRSPAREVQEPTVAPLSPAVPSFQQRTDQSNLREDALKAS